MGHSDGGWWCLGEVGSGLRRHCVGWRSLLVERRWLPGRKSVAAGESRAALEDAFPVASSVVPWKAQNRMVGHPLIRLER